MPKMKTRRGAAKRFKLTASGKLKRNKANHRHMLVRRSNKAKRKMRQSDFVDAGINEITLPHLSFCLVGTTNKHVSMVCFVSF